MRQKISVVNVYFKGKVVTLPNVDKNATADLITLVNIDDSLGCVTDYEDHHHPGQQGYHGLVSPVGEEDGEGDYFSVMLSPFS